MMSARDVPAFTTLKERKPGQNSETDVTLLY
jgi:hypothetical protein